MNRTVLPTVNAVIRTYFALVVPTVMNLFLTVALQLLERSGTSTTLCVLSATSHLRMDSSLNEKAGPIANKISTQSLPLGVPPVIRTSKESASTLWVPRGIQNILSVTIAKNPLVVGLSMSTMENLIVTYTTFNKQAHCVEVVARRLQENVLMPWTKNGIRNILFAPFASTLWLVVPSQRTMEKGIARNATESCLDENENLFYFTSGLVSV